MREAKALFRAPNGKSAEPLTETAWADPPVPTIAIFYYVYDFNVP
jgi:uncharacterized membrane-anchored protein